MVSEEKNFLHNILLLILLFVLYCQILPNFNGSDCYFCHCVIDNDQDVDFDRCYN